MESIEKKINIKPFYKDQYGLIYNADCLKVMKEIPDGSVDLVLTDPPFIYNDYSPGNVGFDEKPENIKFIKSMSGGFDIVEFMTETKRLCKKFNLVIFCSKHQIPEIMKYGFDNKFQTNMLIWKKGGRPFGITYLHDIEYIIHIRETGAPFNGQYKSRVIEGTSKRKNDHATEKPIKIISKLLFYSSNRSDLILDPFLGSGTTAVACKELGRKFIGIEISPEYCKIAQDHLRQEVFKI